MSPEKIAIAVAVTIAAIAGTGAMKNVTGTSRAVAIVAVSPGHCADEEAEQRRDQHHDEVVRVEHHRERLRPCAAHDRGPSTSCAAGYHAMPCSNPHGNGTLSSL